MGAFLKGLKDRGLRGVQLVTLAPAASAGDSDDHEGLGAARRAILGKCSLAALPISPAAKYGYLCATPGHAR